jgi:hypothetical protein
LDIPGSPVEIQRLLQNGLGGLELPNILYIGGLQTEEGGPLGRGVRPSLLQDPPSLIERVPGAVEVAGHPLGVGERAPGSRLKVRDALRPHAGRIEPRCHLDGEMTDVHRLGRILTQIPAAGFEQAMVEPPGLESRIV